MGCADSHHAAVKSSIQKDSKQKVLHPPNSVHPVRSPLANKNHLKDHNHHNGSAFHTKLPDHGVNERNKHIHDSHVSKKGDSSVHDGNTHHTKCDICDKWPILCDRYRCLECTDFDVCGECFEKRRETESHKSGHAFAHFKLPMELFGRMIGDVDQEVTMERLVENFQNAKHQGVACDGCSTKSITGIRFKCDTCPSYDLCLKCMKKKKETRHHTAKHPLIVIDENNLNVIEMSDIELGHKLGQGNFGKSIHINILKLISQLKYLYITLALGILIYRIGSVYKAKWISRNQQVACKVFDVLLNPQLIKSFVEELSAYNELSGAYILKLYGYVHHTLPDSNGGVQCMLIMENMNKGSLTSVIQKEKVSIITKLNMALNIASGMRKIHGRKMIHRDIRPDNILVNDEYIAKIGDLGIAYRIQTTAQQMATNTGCISYMPPEFYKHKCDQSLDVFTFGLTLYFIFTETFHAYEEEGNIIKLTKNSPVFEEIIERCAHHDSKQRPLAVELESIFALYKRIFEKYAAENNFDYKSQPLNQQNRFFLEFYRSFHKRDKASMETQFSRARADSYDFTASDAIKSTLFAIVMKNALEKEIEGKRKRKGGEKNSNDDSDSYSQDDYDDDDGN
ncbi:unnamed protein product [Rotaria socialis]|uniref:Uncharacterized protein n=1 Tax=Rotaria socialis TaxID=392032 RepID=A0A817Y2H7_9BILA|nr:unnamed protein product [Rotaria socialis]